jgi:hypothetical protein
MLALLPGTALAFSAGATLAPLPALNRRVAHAPQLLLEPSTFQLLADAVADPILLPDAQAAGAAVQAAAEVAKEDPGWFDMCVGPSARPPVRVAARTALVLPQTRAARRTRAARPPCVPAPPTCALAARRGAVCW